MKELLRKKSVKIVVLVIILLVVMGIVGINVQSAQKDKEYEAHIALAEKYLSELDYEQAIAEYTMAFEIDPREEVVEALEQTYLAYAQTYIDAGDYETAVSILEEGYEKIGRERFRKVEEALEQAYLAYAETYIEAGDYEMAADILQEGYEKIEWDSLKRKSEEVAVLLADKKDEDTGKKDEKEPENDEEEEPAEGMVEFPFQMKDIEIMGFGLSGDYLAQLLELYPIEGEGQWLEENSRYSNGSGYIAASDESYRLETYYTDWGERRVLSVSGHNGSHWTYIVNYDKGSSTARSVNLNISCELGSKFDAAGIHAPVMAGESYEDWCRVMQIDRIKENNLRPEIRDGQVGIWREDGSVSWGVEEGCEYWLFATEGYQGIYAERDWSGGCSCKLTFYRTGSKAEGEQMPEISVDMNNGVIIVIGKALMLSPPFPPLSTVRESFLLIRRPNESLLC